MSYGIRKLRRGLDKHRVHLAGLWADLQKKQREIKINTGAVETLIDEKKAQTEPIVVDNPSVDQV